MNIHGRGSNLPRLPAFQVGTALTGLGVAFGLTVSAASPRVLQVEPPNWWVGHSLNPVRLLLSGHDLGGARVEAPPDFATDRIQISQNGDYLFMDLRIPQDATPAKVPLHVVTKAGETTVLFPLLAPLDREGRFQGFTPDDVIYLIMTDRFADGDPSNDEPRASPGLFDRGKPRYYHGGDFQGVMDQLGYLKKLGVTAIWLTPWYDNVNHLNHVEKYSDNNKRSANGAPSTDYHGYGAVDFYATEEHFGDLQLLRKLVDRAHAMGIKMIQDQVANHTGPYHPWVNNPPTPGWYNGSPADHLDNPWQTWTLAVSNPPPDKLKATLEGWFLNILPDLNQNDPETATYLIQNSLWWVGMTGVDAIRQDTLPYVPRSYWSRWTTALKREYPALSILGEMWDRDPKLVSFFQGGQARFDGVDSGVETLFDFPLQYAIRDVFAKGAPMTRLSETLAADTNYVDSRVLVPFLGLHDTSRFLNEPGATVDGLKLAFSFLLTTRGTPLIYYGDEIALRGGGDPDNRRDFPGGWSGDPRDAFEPSGRTPEQAAMYSHVAKLLRLRRELEPLRRGKLVNLLVGRDTYVFARVTADKTVIVALNNSRHEQDLTVSVGPLDLPDGQTLRNRLDDRQTAGIADAKMSISMPSRNAAVFTP